MVSSFLFLVRTYDLIFGIYQLGTTLSFEQVFSPDLPEPQVITYGPGPRAIAYNSESRLVSSEDDASESSSEDRLLPGRIVLEENEFVSDYESGSEWGSESGSDFSSDLSSNSESSSEAA